MTKMDKDELVRRYVYDVVRRLPQNQRADIEQELLASIQDMLAAKAQDGDYTEQHVREVLEELGKPADLAANYMDGSRALISGDYYNKYLFILKIVIPCVVLGLAIALVVQVLAAPQEVSGYVVLEFFGNVVYGLFVAFAFVTFFFAILERAKVRFDFMPYNLDDLPPVPRESAIIKKGEPIAGIIFTTLVLLLFNVGAPYLGTYFGGDGQTIQPIFNLTVLHTVLPLLNLCFMLGIIREIMRVVVGRYTVKLAVFITIINIVALALALYIFTNPQIWNTHITAQLTFLEPNVQEIIAFGFRIFYSIFPYVLVFAYVLDSATSIYKAVRYGR